MTVATTFQDLVTNDASILADPDVDGVVLAGIGHSITTESGPTAGPCGCSIAAVGRPSNLVDGSVGGPALT